MQGELSIPKAAQLLPRLQRVMIVGTSGGGKSTLAAKIAETFDLEHIPLDRDMRWLPGWQVRDRQEQRDLHDAFCERERWVIDGTSISLFPKRLARTDLVIWMRPSRWEALWGLVRRIWRSHGQTRADMAPGCPEQLPDREFLSYIWNFEKRQSPRIVAAIETLRAEVPIVIVRSHMQGESMLALARSRFAKPD